MQNFATKIRTAMPATIDLGEYFVTITPKRLKSDTRADARVWRKIERDYRAIRSGRTRSRYPFLYGR